MKIKRYLLTIILLESILANSLLFAQNAINVHISPDKESVLIGSLETLSLAVNAEWLGEMEPIPGWRPIHYRGEFLVYLDSQDLGKDFAPLPGSKYLISPSPDSEVLTIATESDTAEIVTIDPRYCHVSLETIVLGYIQDGTTPAPATPNLAKPTQPGAHNRPKLPDTSAQTRILEGVLVATNTFESVRSGFQFKIINDDNKTLAYLDDSQLSDFVLVDDYVNQRLIATGKLNEIEKVNAFALQAESLKKKY